MPARKPAATRKSAPAEPIAPTRDDVLADTLRRMGACATLADAGRVVACPEPRLKSFRQNIRNDGTFRSKGGEWNEVIAARVYANRPFVRTLVDAYVDSIVGPITSDAPADAPASTT